MRTSRALRAAVGAAALSFAVCSAAVADDDDDDDGPARDLECTGCVGTGDIADGAVGFDNLAPAVVTAIEEGQSLDPVTVTVNCRAGESLQTAIDAARPGQATTIVVTEGCREDVVIRKDDITLDGDPLGTGDPAIRGNIGAVTLEGAHRVAVRNLSIVGLGAGFRAGGGASFRLEGATIVSGETIGVSIREGSHGIIEDSRIESNGERNAVLAPGILVDEGSVARIVGNEISVNAGDGILVANGSFALIEDNTLEFNAGRGVFSEANLKIASATVLANGNRIRLDGNVGVIVENGGVYKAGVVLSRVQPDNPLPFEEISAGISGVALVVRNNGTADLRQVRLTGDIEVASNSLLVIGGDVEEPNKIFSSIDGNISVRLKSLVSVENPVDFNGSCTEDLTSLCD